MEKGMRLRRFICEHKFVSGMATDNASLDMETLKHLHKNLRQEITVLNTYSNIGEQIMYSVIDAHDRQSIESFFRDMRIPLDGVMEIDLQVEGRGRVTDLRKLGRAA